MGYIIIIVIIIIIIIYIHYIILYIHYIYIHYIYVYWDFNLKMIVKRGLNMQTNHHFVIQKMGIRYLLSGVIKHGGLGNRRAAMGKPWD